MGSLKHGWYAIPLTDQAPLQKDPGDREMGGLHNAATETCQAGAHKSCRCLHNIGPANGQSWMRKESIGSYPSWLLMDSGGGEESLSCFCSFKWVNAVGHKTKDVSMEKERVRKSRNWQGCITTMRMHCIHI